jgi:ABC-type cobalamin/Fe3+-siderophores transport system ATPase subunit
MIDFPGARWWKFDFHTHTPASLGDFLLGVPQQERADITPETWLLKYMQAGIDCVAITDHNTGEWIDRLKQANRSLAERRPEGYRDLCVFPGVEISANGGVHLLAVLDPEDGSREIATLLAEVQYSGTRGHSDGVTECSLVQIAEKVARRGGLLIPAHVDQEKGLLRLRQTHDAATGARQSAVDPGTLRQLLEHPSVLAMGVVDASIPKPAVYEEVSPRWTEVLGSDCHNFRNGPAPGSRYTLVKMASPSLEGLRLALVDGNDFSVRRMEAPDASDPNQTPEDWIEAIRVEEARYMGRGEAAELRLSPWMTALVGGRGTGKSTVLYFLRASLRRRDELDLLAEDSEPRRAFDRFLKVHRTRRDEGGLEAKTAVSVTLNHQGSRFMIDWRADDTYSVKEAAPDGGWQPAASQAVRERFRVRLFSQGQVLALADRSTGALLDLVDEAADTSALRTSLDEETRRFLRLRSQLRELDQKLASRDRVTAQVQDARRKLAAFEQAQHAEVLRDHQRRSRQVREIEGQVEAVNGFAAEIESLSDRLVLADPPEGLFLPVDPADAAAEAALRKLRKEVASTAGGLRTAAVHLRSTAAGLRAETLGAAPGTAAGTVSVGSAAAEARVAYESVVKTLKAQGVTNPDEYGRLVQDRQRLEADIASLDALQGRRAEVEQEAEASRQRLFVRRRELQDRRRGFLDENLAQNPFVHIALEPYGRDGRNADRSLREVLDVMDDRFKSDLFDDTSGTPSGSLASLFAGLESETFEGRRTLIEQRLEALRGRMAAAAASRPSDLGGHFVNFLERMQQRQPETVDRVLTWSPSDDLTVEYSPRGDGRDFQSIEQGSPGQRAAAMLAFFLAYGREPIVFDQPEDDLDNHLIYDLVVRQLQESKRVRQVVVVTHNPNIVVNGDAEMVHALDFGGGQCHVKARGALQEAAVREEVCRVMEGGREAFQRRYRRLVHGGRDAR